MGDMMEDADLDDPWQWCTDHNRVESILEPGDHRSNHHSKCSLAARVEKVLKEEVMADVRKALQRFEAVLGHQANGAETPGQIPQIRKRLGVLDAERVQALGELVLVAKAGGLPCSIAVTLPGADEQSEPRVLRWTTDRHDDFQFVKLLLATHLKNSDDGFDVEAAGLADARQAARPALAERVFCVPGGRCRVAAMHPDGCLFLALTHQLAGRSGEAPSPLEAAEVRRSVAYHVKDRVKAGDNRWRDLMRDRVPVAEGDDEVTYWHDYLERLKDDERQQGGMESVGAAVELYRVTVNLYHSRSPKQTYGTAPRAISLFRSSQGRYYSVLKFEEDAVEPTVQPEPQRPPPNQANSNTQAAAAAVAARGLADAARAQQQSRNPESQVQPPTPRDLPHQCRERDCGKRFASEVSLKKHISGKHRRRKRQPPTGFDPPRRNAGKAQPTKPCPRCGKVIRGSKLEEHMRTHTGERPFSCTVCRQKFRQKGHVQQHMPVHENHTQRPHRCSKCPTGFHSAAALKRHEEFAHSGGKEGAAGKP